MFATLKRVAILVGVVMAFASGNGHAVSALTVGTPQQVGFTFDGFVSDVLIDVKRGWLNPEDQFLLSIRIYGVKASPAMPYDRRWISYPFFGRRGH